MFPIVATNGLLENPVTADLPAAASTAGQLGAVRVDCTSVSNILFVLRATAKVWFSDTNANAVTMFASVASAKPYVVLPAGVYQFSAEKQLGNYLYFEALTGAAVSGGLSTFTERI